jgi:CBS domain-containing protein
MRRSVLSVRPDDPVETAMDLMVEWQLRSLPVVERQDGVERLVGVVSRGDVLRCLMLDGDAPD